MVIENLDANHFTGAELAEKIRSITPKTLTVYFNEANFLVSPYFLNGAANAIMIVENRKGDELHVHHCNCGYSGHGPSNTQKVLVGLGLSTDYADEIKYCNGITATFDDDGKLTKDHVITGAPFETRAAHMQIGNIYYSDMIANLSRKQLYVLNCKGKNLIGILKCLDLVSVESFEYYVGDHNEEVQDFSLPYDVNVLGRYKTTDIKGSYIWVNAKPFSIICFIGKEAPFAFINSIYCAITGNLLFEEIERENPIVDVRGNLSHSLVEWMQLVISIFRPFSNKKTYHERIQIEGAVKYE